MTMNQVKKLRKIVRIKKLATKGNKLFVCITRRLQSAIGWYQFTSLPYYLTHAHNFNAEK